MCNVEILGQRTSTCLRNYGFNFRTKIVTTPAPLREEQYADLIWDASNNILISLYNSLFSSFLNYGITVWGLTFESYLNPLFRLQKKVLRCIKFEPFSAPTAPIFQSLKFLKLEATMHPNILSFVYKAINKFHNYFLPNSTVHKIGTLQATRGDLFKSFKEAVYQSKG